MALVWLLVGGLLVALLWTFGAQNSQPVDVQYYGIQVLGAPLWLVAVVAVALGLLLATLATLPGRVRGMMTTRRLRQQVQQQERTIGALQGQVGELQRGAGPGLGSTSALPGDAGGALSDVPDASAGSRLWQ
ncbi:MAG TPA: lipopolysaccharide assembly protein LapA domain-containing protein [Chloroflexota bacterium]|nr:lipopolysaccharide assembly protein LapA domain-containing protein [Chloroflexota bacterium]